MGEREEERLATTATFVVNATPVCNGKLERLVLCVCGREVPRAGARQVGAPPVTFRVEETKKKFFFPGSGESFNPLRLFLPLNEKI